ncbi:MAG TPA: ATP-dependent RNA helicase DbpA [Pusillimonas sp.]|uniref:ATP-dependent RNA helicase DbpA n=1 Tax=Pusillimonas sp. TaxID=3040095 RepID=UPI002C0DD60A|nr:ATP-dependent RNA helicase DbpA [Pusillimonas sp.]HUH88019.1 ATP-dependent RNA helicase DbpA [Pusillimonas sp.]
MNSPLSFSSTALSSAVLNNLDQLGYQQMTPIQAHSLPPMLEGRDIIAQAMTGSGKTAAFGLGIMHTLNPAWFGTQALVLCPTRELAAQVAQELRRLARHAANIKVLVLAGGASLERQIDSLRHGAHIIVATPGRFCDHLGRNTIDLSGLRTLVLDEADRMIDMGFYDDMATIVAACPRKRQTLFFSATYPDNVQKSAARFLRDPVQVKVESQLPENRLEQHFYEISADQRLEAVARLLMHFRPVSTLAFCNTKAQVHELTEFLQARGFSALALHGDFEQRDREDILVQFANQSCSVLVATDVAARGLDMQSVDAVINVELAPQPEVHVHRVGRTSRSGAKGLALSLVSQEEMYRAQRIEQYQDAPLPWQRLDAVSKTAGKPPEAPMLTLCIQGGKKSKLRAGDLVGALTKDAGLPFDSLGKIDVLDFVTFVALKREIADETYDRLANSTIKGRRFKMRFM